MAGFFGKLPSKGDFVTRDLPRDFYQPFDELQHVDVCYKHYLAGFADLVCQMQYGYQISKFILI